MTTRISFVAWSLLLCAGVLSGCAESPDPSSTAVGRSSVSGQRDLVTVAVAANFLSPLQALETRFEAQSYHRLEIVAGSTGQLYAQIVNGAPYDLFLAADQRRPRMLVDDGWADADVSFTYAVGRLALWSHDADYLNEASLDQLGQLDFRWLAIANPAVAPYGAAAQATLESLGIWNALQSRLVRGQSVAQTFALIESGNAELGLIAYSQALAYQGESAYVIVPQALHQPIFQDAVLLRSASENAAALAFRKFLQSSEAASIIEQYGYVAAQN
jgi:molybdate transport system substrate-binding protein